MEHYIKLENEIERQKQLIEDNETMMDQVPNHLKPYQEMALNLLKDKLEKLEARLTNFRICGDK